MVGIYKITNNANGKIYIGQSENIERRWRAHINASKRYNYPLYVDMRKYGVDNFSFEVLEECRVDELDVKEKDYIKKLNAYIHKKGSNGYNMTLGGKNNTTGMKFSVESRKKMSLAKQGYVPYCNGKPRKQEHIKKLRESFRANYKKENHPMYGKHLSDTTKEKIRQANLGKKHTEETRKRMSESRKGSRNANYGKKWTDEQKRMASERNIGKQAGAKHPNSKYLICDNKVYGCVRECAEVYNINRRTMNAWLTGKRRMPQKFIDLKLHRATAEELEQYGLKN